MSNQVGVPGNLAALEVHRLQKAVEDFSRQATKQTNQMLKLTRVLAWLTAAMTILACGQLYLVIFR